MDRERDYAIGAIYKLIHLAYRDVRVEDGKLKGKVRGDFVYAAMQLGAEHGIDVVALLDTEEKRLGKEDKS